MAIQEPFETRIDKLIVVYGDGSDGAAPDKAQWQSLAALPQDSPATLINRFQIRETAAYPAESEFSGTGGEAIMRYAATSMHVLESLGGSFLLTALVHGTLIGEPGEWNLVAIGSYPEARLIFDLFERREYQAAFLHRKAACARQEVLICAG